MINIGVLYEKNWCYFSINIYLFYWPSIMGAMDGL